MGKERDLPKGLQSKVHQCIRRTEALTVNSLEIIWEANPCVDYSNLTFKENKQFKWCPKIV